MRDRISGQPRSRFRAWLLPGIACLAAAGWSQTIAGENLAGKYKEWLDLTQHISLPQEREVFSRLATDRERDIFIEAFWKQRDPTPGTPQNEYRDEIINRFAYANRQFGRGTTRPGWLTDMGKIYILLGAPATRERYDELRGMYPCEAWYYYGDPAKGLPTYFGFLFYKKRGIGEYMLYHQVQDGPAALLIDGHDYDPADYFTLYQRIREISPPLAPLTISMIPSETPSDFRPSLRTDAILSGIFSSPRKDVSPSYATHFLNFRGVVSTEYLTNYVELEGLAEVMPDAALEMSFVHFSLTPKSISVDYYRPKDRYFCNYSVDVSLRSGEKVVFQYTKEFPFYYSPSDDPVVRANGISLQDSFPVIEGRHQLTVLVRNSVGKEFSVFEKEILVDGKAGPRIAGALLGYGIEAASPGLHAPFQVQDKKLSLDSRQTYIAADELTLAFGLAGMTRELWEKGEVRVEIRNLEAAAAEKTVILKPSLQPHHPLLAMMSSFPANELKPGYYEISLSLVDGQGAVVDTKTENFILSPAEAVPRPVAISKSFPLSNAHLYCYMLADQYDKAGRPENAQAFFQRGYDFAPGYQEGILYFADFMVRSGGFVRALELSEKLAEGGKYRFERFLLKGRALMGLGKYREAIESLSEGNKIYDSDTGLLNALGLCYSRTGEKEKALAALAASLRLNPDQPDVRKLVEEIKK